MKPSAPYVSAFFSKIYLLLWKNMIHLKRQYFVTSCEIILPTLGVILLAYLHNKVDSYSSQSGRSLGRAHSSLRQASNRPMEYDENWAKKVLFDELRTSDCSNWNDDSVIIGYVSKNQLLAEKILKNMVEDVFQNLSCTHKVTYEEYNSEDKMELSYSYLNPPPLKDRYDPYNPYRKAGSNSKFALGIVFEELTDKTATYKIRLPDFNGDTVDLLQDGGSNSGDEYFRTSFTAMQLLLDKALIQHFTGNDPQYKTSFQPFPDPIPGPNGRTFRSQSQSTRRDRDTYFLQYFEYVIIIMFFFIVPSVVTGVVSEKQTGIKELMKMSGLPEWMHWFGWMINSLIVYGITVTIITFIAFVPFSSNSSGLFADSDPILVWVILMVYVMWAVTYCFALSAFFERPVLATTLGVFIWFASYFGLATTMDGYYGYGRDFSVGVKTIFCLFPNVGMHFTLTTIQALETSEIGAKWGNMGDTFELFQVPLATSFLMILASSFLNLVICLYFEAVLPKKFGVRKPFYFIFLPSEWGCRCSRRSAVNRIGYGQFMPNSERPGFESEPIGSEAGVQIVNLRKTFGKHKVAVNDVSMNILKGQIFCLLGENGAGKTTTMSILTGLLAPTTGTAFINGLNITTDMEKIRQSLGLCPQHNMLFDKMTVFEHLKFFGMLKGLSKINANAEAMYLLQVLRFSEKQKVLSKKLSGGQKRKLSLGCSIVGGSKILFLDEPTSGMDPEARRAIWDILLSIRHDRTIVLTTHTMEEADVLGDRIGIMSSGTLQCCGSPSYLKRFYGAGYVLSMTIMDGADREMILTTVRNHIPDAYFKVSYSNNAAELSVVLPSENNTCSLFPALFSEITEKQNDLGIAEIGVGWTTMDDVFVRVEEISHGQPVDIKDSVDNQSSMDSGTKLVKVQGFKLFVGQFYGLLMKNIIWTFRKKGLMMFQMLIAVLFAIIAALSNFASPPPGMSKAAPPLKFSLSSYNNPVTLYSSIDAVIGDAYVATVNFDVDKSAKLISSTFNNDVYNASLNVAKKDDASYRKRHIIAGEISLTNMKAMYSTVAPHSAPLSMNMMTNTMLRHAVGKESKVLIINHPLGNKINDLLAPLKEESKGKRNLYFVTGICFGALFPVGFALFVASFLLAPTDERLSNAKQLQMMTGASPMLYWGSKFIWDFFLTLITICLMLACLAIFESNKVFTHDGGAGVLFLIMMVYGISSLSFMYLLSTRVRTTSGGFTLVTILQILMGPILGFVSFTLDAYLSGGGFPMFVNVIGGLFPSFAATKAAMLYAYYSVSNVQCYALTDEAIELLCDPSFNAHNFGVTQDCCDNCRLGFPQNLCSVKVGEYMNWEGSVIGAKTTQGPGYAISMEARIPVAGISQDLTWLIVLAVLYFAILLIIDYGVCKNAQGNQNAGMFRKTVSDADVIEESNRVDNLVAEGRTFEDAIVIHNLCKSYETFLAVNALSFGVHHGECFGLLGVNGAGKTTTFRMLTGDENRSFGNSFVRNLSLSLHRNKFFANLGYCPQFDAFVGGLTGKEMLSLFARLRGVPFRSVKKETEKWLRKTGLTESGKVKCQKYSGGMKRRLSAAMALIGDPQVILMDEPTSGVDPVARRQFWKIITSVKNSGQSIILTSHSMEECEALCSRVAIMVNGEFQCLGGVQHLKSKFVQGYSLTIKLKQENYQNTEMTNKISNDVLNIFNPCSLKDHHQTTMKFQILSQERTWEDLYRTMEGIKEDNQECIEEYAITETTLEEVFLAFARAQQEHERVVKGGQSRTNS